MSAHGGAQSLSGLLHTRPSSCSRSIADSWRGCSFGGNGARSKSLGVTKAGRASLLRALAAESVASAPDMVIYCDAPRSRMELVTPVISGSDVDTAGPGLMGREISRLLAKVVEADPTIVISAVEVNAQTCGASRAIN